MKEKCISCESIGEENDATHVIEMFGDMIPLCDICHEGLLENAITKIYLDDEEYQD